MNIQEFKKSAAITEFNTNNGWGFGGKSGKQYSNGKFYIQVGKWSYRHAPCESFVLYFIDNIGTTKSLFEEEIINFKG